ncbi:MAG: DUF4159 domain-containing protein, partial [Planctomycetes bacterium]|nr:DUF4159 domain-containing protein [Planctomycetota bacterium]
RRVATGVNVEKRTVGLTAKEVADCQVLFMTGNLPFSFTDTEVNALRNYLAGGGTLWVNDSSREGDETFDKSFRREIERIIRTPIIKLKKDHPLLKSAYDFSKGYHGYSIPPGDKYRVDYLEGVEWNNRLAVLYTRNDYADGMALDPTLNPMRQSLTDLSAEDMLEGSLRFGINVITYAMGGSGAAVVSEDKSSSSDSIAALDEKSISTWQDFTALTDETVGWVPVRAITNPQEGAWGNPSRVLIAPDGAGGEAMRVDIVKGDQDKVAIKYDIPAKDGRRLDLSKTRSILLDVYNGHHGGFRFSLVLTTINGENKWQDFESPSIYLRPGWNRSVRFVINGSLFKSRKTGWVKYDTKLEGADSCGKISIFFYNSNTISSSVLVDNIRFEAIK